MVAFNRRDSMRRGIAALSAVVLALTALATGTSAASAQGTSEVEFHEQVLFDRSDDVYGCVRIPSIVETSSGALLAIAEGRKSVCGDSGDIDIVLRRSHDGGDTWGPIEVVQDNGADTAGNPMPVVDRESGRIALITSRNPVDDRNDRSPWLQISEDDGVSWSEPESLKGTVSDPGWDKWLATGPGAGIQLQHGEHAGRMLVGMSHEQYGEDGPEGDVFGADLAYSDDGGLTWRLGAVDQHPRGALHPQEINLVERADGSVLVTARDQHGTDPGNRAFAVSSDGGESFDAPFENDPDLVTPVVQGSLTRLDADRGDGAPDRILLAAPALPKARGVMAVRSSFDGGDSWQTWDEGRVVNWGNAAYSDITVLSDGTIGMLYETGDEDAYREIRLARFNEAYLDAPNGDPPGSVEWPVGPTTPELSSAQNPAYVRGGASVVDGVVGGALEFDLAPNPGDFDDRVDVPYSEAIDLDDSDFTVSTWFRYGEASHAQTIFWAYFVGSGKPGIWARAEPGNDRIRAFLGTETGEANAIADGARNDGEWHHLALTRGGGDLELWMDGQRAASEPAPDGSITVGGELMGIDGFFIGQRLDGINRFDGAIDEVRVYDRALTDEQITRLATPAAGNAPRGWADRDLVLYLPLDDVHPADGS